MPGASVPTKLIDRDYVAMVVAGLKTQVHTLLTVRGLGKADVSTAVDNLFVDAERQLCHSTRRPRPRQEDILALVRGLLTPAEARVMAEVLRGKATKTIAWEIGSSESTVKAHIFKRLTETECPQPLRGGCFAA